MTNCAKCISPIDGSLYAERPFLNEPQIAAAIESARQAQRHWQMVSLPKRIEVCQQAVNAMMSMKDQIAIELAWQMGRPIRYGGGELNGFQERSVAMLELAESALAPVVPPEKPGFVRYIQREPLGLVFTIAPWNYPFLTAVNSILPALVAGNSVLLKHAQQTMLVGERFAQAFQQAGLPDGVFQNLVLDHPSTERIVASGAVQHVCFTGSVAGGRHMEKAAAGTFATLGLELGGKDPAYVRSDANLSHAVESLVDGAFFNSGQSCCGIERIYVDQDLFEPFVQQFVELTKQYQLGNPLDTETTLGPLAKASAVAPIRQQVASAVAAGATAHIAPSDFPAFESDSAYLAPQVLTNVTHKMEVMTEETFGPVVGIMSVHSEDDAIQLMNDSVYGLTASIWTADVDAATRIGQRLETGTVFMNRADYLDPYLAWTGVKQTGHGCTLSRIGYESLTRPKSFHFRTSV
ncbi:MAG: aldehyde dehydrogenase family protein [Planctomycetales bacterium]|nr:aldehyde dehydrogenase family protein [Planctomycetales bacterium]